MRAFLQEKLTPELRQAGRVMTTVYADHEASMEWQRIPHERGWAAPAWAVECGGCDWSLTQHYIFGQERAELGQRSALAPNGGQKNRTRPGCRIPDGPRGEAMDTS